MRSKQHKKKETSMKELFESKLKNDDHSRKKLAEYIEKQLLILTKKPLNEDDLGILLKNGYTLKSYCIHQKLPTDSDKKERRFPIYLKLELQPPGLIYNIPTTVRFEEEK